MRTAEMTASASVLRPAPSVAGAVATAIADDHHLIDTTPAHVEQQQVAANTSETAGDM
jgi:hypothetical protein